jgi:membrane protease YdiL (CAAX protease family)
MTQLRNLNPATSTLLLLAGFALSVWLRISIGGPGVAQSPWAGLAFAGCLAGLGIVSGVTTKFDTQALRVGLLGGLALLAPALIARLALGGAFYSYSGYAGWAIVVAVVAAAEEYFFRGALFDSAHRWTGETGAILIPAVAFASLHVPLYGWHVVPLDLAVGIWLGALRVTGRSWAAPAIAHILADLFAWWLR